MSSIGNINNALMRQQIAKFGNNGQTTNPPQKPKETGSSSGGNHPPFRPTGTGVGKP